MAGTEERNSAWKNGYNRAEIETEKRLKTTEMQWTNFACGAWHSVSLVSRKLTPTHFRYLHELLYVPWMLSVRTRLMDAPLLVGAGAFFGFSHPACSF
jgi:hypothetical protein